jgi:hypothetical protein
VIELPDTKPYPTGSCRDSKCTEGLVLDTFAAVGDAGLVAGNLEGVVSQDLAKDMTKVAITTPNTVRILYDRFTLVRRWDISVKLNSYQSSCNGKCGNLPVCAKVGSSLSSLLGQLDISVPGILALVRELWCFFLSTSLSALL